MHAVAVDPSARRARSRPATIWSIDVDLLDRRVLVPFVRDRGDPEPGSFERRRSDEHLPLEPGART